MSKQQPKQNIRFLKRRHERAGFDSDYISKLSPEEAGWMESFARNYYDGAETDPERKREANHRRYMKEFDAQNDSLPLDDEEVDTLDPEKILLLKEEIEARAEVPPPSVPLKKCLI